MKKILLTFSVVALIATAIMSKDGVSDGNDQNLCQRLIGTLQGCLGSVGAKVVIPVNIVMNERGTPPTIILNIENPGEVDRAACANCVDSYNVERVNSGCLSLPVLVLV